MNKFNNLPEDFKAYFNNVTVESTPVTEVVIEPEITNTEALFGKEPAANVSVIDDDF